jgi:hypothetical protein
MIFPSLALVLLMIKRHNAMETRGHYMTRRTKADDGGPVAALIAFYLASLSKAVRTSLYSGNLPVAFFE